MSIVVRAARDTDRTAIASIYASEAVTRWTAQAPFRDENFWAGFYKERGAGTELVAEDNGTVIGHLGILTNNVPRRRHVASFGIAVHESHHGRGAGSALMAAMIALCDDYLNIVRLELSVDPENLGAIALYEKFGFSRESVARFTLFTKGRYANSLTMVRFHPGYAPMLKE
jgi:putative acetyltransferase